MLKLTAVKRALKRSSYGLRLRLNRLRGRSFVELNSFFSFEVSGVCNLSCRICAYPHKEIGKSVMSTDEFSNLLEQALDLGYQNIGLTPMTGDIFMDKDIMSKMDLLEQNPRVKSFWFYTNFILLDEEKIKRLSTMHKLGPTIYISLYGHDDEMFARITDRPIKQYKRLLENLNYLADVAKELPCPIDIGIRTSASFVWKPEPNNTDEPNPLLRAINRLMATGNCQYSGNILEYDSWGGLVTQKDLDDLEMTVVGPSASKTPKVGACALIFDRPTIFPDGRVNACHCHGVDGSLVVGNIHDHSLMNILSSNNERFMDLIANQQQGNFPEACNQCIFYRSIYRALKKVPTIRYEEYMEIIHDRANPPADPG